MILNVSHFKSLPELLDYFKNESTCRAYLEQQRWGGEISCPHCGYGKVYRTGRGFTCANTDCKKVFTVTVKTVFENTKLKLRIWFAAIYILTAHKKGISSCQLARDLNITQRSAWFLNHRIRKMLSEQTLKEQKMFTGTVQIDESFIGGKRKNMHRRRREMLTELFGAGGSADKYPIFGMLQEGGQVMFMPVPSTEADVLQPIIEKYIAPGSTIITDTHQGYNGLDTKYTHVTVNHRNGSYVTPEGQHNNSIESAWSMMKRGYVGIYHYMSQKHLHRYCVEFVYRFNTRKISDSQRFEKALLNTSGRLKYKELTARAN